MAFVACRIVAGAMSQTTRGLGLHRLLHSAAFRKVRYVRGVENVNCLPVVPTDGF